MNKLITQINFTTDQVPGEPFLISSLQKRLAFSLKDKVVKRGKLLLFKRVSFHIQISLLTDKNIKENFEIPIPFRVESHEKEGLMYYDYRLESLNTSVFPIIPEKVSSSYFNRILEVSVI